MEQEAYFTWSALFSEALYQRELVRSLSQRSDELAISYQREREMAAAVRASEQRYALAARAANDGLWDWDLATGTIYLSPRLQEMLGVDQADIDSGPDQWLKHVHPEDRAGLLATISGLETGETTSMTYELRAQVGDGPLLVGALPGPRRPWPGGAGDTHRWFHDRHDRTTVTGGAVTPTGPLRQPDRVAQPGAVP